MGGDRLRLPGPGATKKGFTVTSPDRSSAFRILFAAAALLLCGFFLPAAVAQENDDCMMCHEDPDMTGERDGSEISIYVDLKKYASVGPRRSRLHHVPPGPRRRRVAPRGRRRARVDCSFCHDSEAERHAASLHGQAAARGDAMAPTCDDCHGKHDIRLPHRSRFAHGDDEHPAALRDVPPRGIARLPDPRHPPGPDPRELLAQHPRRGAVREGPHRHRGLHLLPHLPRHPSPRRTAARASTGTTSPRPARSATPASSRCTAR